jgi:hypothetical protein
MSLTSNPLFDTVLDAVRRIVTSIDYGLQFNEHNIEVEEPTGNHITIPRVQWKRELQVAQEFFESSEYYEDCARCVDLIAKLDAEPTIEQIIRQISDNAQQQNED